jgi:hypothetical protein
VGNLTNREHASGRARDAVVGLAEIADSMLDNRAYVDHLGKIGADGAETARSGGPLLSCGRAAEALPVGGDRENADEATVVGDDRDAACVRLQCEAAPDLTGRGRRHQPSCP